MPPDPCTDIAVSRYPGVRHSDTLRYTVRMRREDETSDTLAFTADDDGRTPRRMFTSNELHAIYQNFAGEDTSGEVDLLWYVDATDGLFTTRSTAVDSLHPGYRLRLTLLKPPVVASMYFPLAENTTALFTIDNGHDFRGADMRLSVTGSVDTLGHEWWKVETSGAQTPIPALYRNDFDGLHVAREIGGVLVDRLWLPARCAVGDILPMGRVMATGSIAFADVTRETVTIDYGTHGIWTYADSVGLLSVEQGSDAFRLAEIGGWLHPLEPTRAQEQAVPFAPDDLLVHRMAGGGTPVWRNSIIRSGERGKRAWVVNYLGRRSYLAFEYIIDPDDGVFFRVNDRGMLAEYDDRGKDSVELYPAFIPGDSTVLLNNAAWSVGRRFDTIVLGAQCRAFELRRGEYYRVITDRFGEVFCTSASQLAVLHSAVVRDTSFNRLAPAARWFDLCVGNRYQYRYAPVWPPRMQWTEITADTLIDGEQWFLFSGEGPLLGWFRSDSSGFFRRDMATGGVELLFAGRLNIGDLCRWGMVLDTISVNVDGRMRRQMDSYEYGYGYWASWHVRLLEGIGMRDFEMHAWESDKDYELTYAEVCGVPWGRITGIGGTPDGLPVRPTLTVAPQPLRGPGIVQIILPRPSRVRICVFDMLGRERLVVGEGEFPAGASTVALSAAGLEPGLYFIRMNGDAVTGVQRFLVLR
ncbi:MAG: T9SS type A sorting domain-containing protein [Bacteroidetes bacterium]|nr:T9SS type A sorting domain-containing protein [Bacteroidota bacterium]